MYQLTMFLILVCKIPDMLATCALMFVHQGIGQWYIGGRRCLHRHEDFLGAAPARTALSESFSAIGRARGSLLSCWAVCLWPIFSLNFTKHGRYLYAMGGNKEAAKLSGIDVKKYRYLAGMITAAFIAIGGILWHPGEARPRLCAAIPFDAVTGSCFRGTYRGRR